MQHFKHLFKTKNIECLNIIKPNVYRVNLLDGIVGRKNCNFSNNTLKIVKIMLHGDASGILQ